MKLWVVFLDSPSPPCAQGRFSLHWSITTPHALAKHGLNMVELLPIKSLWWLQSMSSLFSFQNTCHWLPFWVCYFLYIQALLKPRLNAFAANAWFNLASFFYSHFYASTLTAIINGAHSFRHIIPHPHLSPYSCMMGHVAACGWTMCHYASFGFHLGGHFFKCSHSVFVVWLREPLLCIPSLCSIGSICPISFISLLPATTKRPQWVLYLSHTYRGFQFHPHIQSQLHTLRSPLL